MLPLNFKIEAYTLNNELLLSLYSTRDLVWAVLSGPTRTKLMEVKGSRGTEERRGYIAAQPGHVINFLATGWPRQRDGLRDGGMIHHRQFVSMISSDPSSCHTLIATATVGHKKEI